MQNPKFDLFIILLKLRSYLISLLDDPSNEYSDFEYTEEFLLRKYPGRKEEILDLLRGSMIQSDGQIAFTEDIQQNFKEIAFGTESSHKLPEILSRYNISSLSDALKFKTVEDNRQGREHKLKEITSVLLQLARIWARRSEIETDIEDFSLLDEEDLIRPDEKNELTKLDHETSLSYGTISKLTEIYLEQLAEYYFRYGGDLSLVNLIDNLDEFKQMVSNKYNNLFREHGLDPGKL